MTRIFLSGLAALALLPSACAAPSSEAGAAVPPALTLTGRVVDAANVIDPATEQTLTMLSADLEQVMGNQFVIATTPSLDGRAIEEYSLDLARGWGIGRRGRDDGVLLLVAPNEKKVRIEVGYGLERTLTNAEAGRIIQTEILPALRGRQMIEGIDRGSHAIVRELIRK